MVTVVLVGFNSRSGRDHAEGHKNEESTISIQQFDTQITILTSVERGAQTRRKQGSGIRKGCDDWGIAFLRSPYRGCIAFRIEVNSPRASKLIKMLCMSCLLSALGNNQM